MPARDLEPILRTMLDAVVMIDGEGIVIGWNPMAEAVFGWSAAEAVGQSMGRLIVPERYRAPHEAGLRRFHETGEARVANRRIEIAACDRNGREFPVELAIVAAPRGSDARFIGFLRDISAREEAKHRLALSEESLRLATDAGEIGTWDLDITSGILTWSDRTKAMFGMSAATPCSMEDFYEGLHGEDRPIVAAAFEAAIDPAVRATYDVEYRTIGRDDGLIRWVAAKGRGLFDADGRCVRAVGTAIDITARKRAEERDALMLALSDALRGADTEAALGQASVLLGRHFRASRAGYGHLDPSSDVFDYQICWTDGSIPPLLGRYPARAFGAKITARLAAGETVVVDDLFDAAISDEAETLATATQVDTRAILVVPFVRDGRLRTIVYLNNREPRHWAADEIAFMEEVADRTREVIARDEAEAALRALAATLEERVAERTRERNLLATLVEGTDTLVHVLDTDYRWLALNRAGAEEFARVYGRRPKVGDNILDLLADRPDEQAAARALWSRALAGEVFTITADFGDPDPTGMRAAYEMKFRTLHDDRGELLGAFQLAADITERVRAAAELELVQDALRQSQKMEAIGQLTGGVAHDFNNLLTVIRSAADLLQRGRLPPERQQRYLAAIVETAERAAKLTGQLLAFSRRQALQPEPFDVCARIAAISDMLNTVLGARIALQIETCCRHCAVEADLSQFETAIVNLAVNARDAMDGEGRLVIAIERVEAMPAIRGQAALDGAFVVVSVADTGCGIDPADMGRIFEPFFTRKEVGKGTGLGLSQVYGFAKQSGGEVEVHSTPGAGATFRIYLPAIDGVHIPSEPAPGPRAHAAPKGRLLVIEDNAEVGEMATSLLAELGYETVLAQSVAEARAVLDGGMAIDLVLSDVVMPGISGIDFAMELRETRPDMPVVLTSGYSHALAHDGHRGFTLVRKPYSLEELAGALERARTAHDQ